MAGDEDGHSIVADGIGDCPGTAVLPNFPGKLFIGKGLAIGNRFNRLPNCLLVGGSRAVPGEGKGPPKAVEIVVELGFQVEQEGTGSGKSGSTGKAPQRFKLLFQIPAIPEFAEVKVGLVSGSPEGAEGGVDRFRVKGSDLGKALGGEAGAPPHGLTETADGLESAFESGLGDGDSVLDP